MKACFHKKDHVSAVIFAKQMSPRGSLILEGLSLLWPHMYSVTCVGSGQFFTLFSSKWLSLNMSMMFGFRRTKFTLTRLLPRPLSVHLTSDVLIFSSISYMRFSRYIWMSRMFPFHPMENTRFELVTSCLQGRRSPN